jgi:hypothetical protein
VNPYLITLQDFDIGIRSPDDVLASSPGFANIAMDKPVFGEEARQLARLHPRQSFNQFWAQLSLDPLSIKNKHFRHTADLAHGHLRSLVAGVNLSGSNVIAVPSNYSRNQLSVLLGIARTCEIPVHGLVDLSLLQAMASDSGADHCIIVDLQLHQAVLSSFRRVDGYMQRERVVQVPASGQLALQDAWTNMIADEFIRQNRFDPKHNAEIEQFLYNQLDGWMTQSAATGELLIDIKHKGSVHQARVTHEAFGLRSRHIFERIRKELAPLTADDSVVHVLGSQHLPGLQLYIPKAVVLKDELLLDSFLVHMDNIVLSPDQVQFITRLPLRQQLGNAAAQPSREPQATHVLLNNKAISLPKGLLAFGAAPADGKFARIIPLEGNSTNGFLVIDKQPGQLVLEQLQGDSVLVNDKSASSGMTLSLGDRIKLDGALLHLIQVE